MLAGLGALGAGAALAGGTAACGADSQAGAPAGSGRVPFHGRHQGGIGTPQQDRLVFAAYDVTTTGGTGDRRAALVRLLKTWTAAAQRMVDGELVPGQNRDPMAPPADTGEAYGLRPANLTITIGFGPSLFDHRFGLASRRPAALADLPHLAPENLDPRRGGGDIAIQACADDPQVAFHAVRNLARLGRGTVVTRWVQLGFGKAAANSAKQKTPRNLFGFKDGTRNIHGEDRRTMDRWVWVGDETDQSWMRGGSYLVSRRIRQNIEAWDRDFLEDQEDVFGRAKYSGAPLSGVHEFDTPDFTKKGPDGKYDIPLTAHIRLAARENNGGVQILRRAFNYTDGMLDNGELDAGLFMIIFQQDPRKQFVALQRKLGAHDGLNEYIQHVASGLYACPPGVRDGEYWGAGLLA